MTSLPAETKFAYQILKHFHPRGLRCAHCGVSVEYSYPFRATRKSKLIVYRCRCCQGIYNLYSQTVFESRHLRPSQVVKLIKGVVQGERVSILAKHLGISRTTASELYAMLKSDADYLRLSYFPALQE